MKSYSLLCAGLAFCSVFTINPLAAQPETIESSQASQSGVVYPERVTGTRHSRPETGPGKLPASAETTEEKEFEKQFGFNPQKKIRKYIEKKSAGSAFPTLSRATLKCLDDPALANCFPNSLFYVLRFMQYPVAVPVPPELSANTLICVDCKGKISKFCSESELKAFYLESSKSIKSDSDIKIVVEAWLSCLKELVQDGMYRFDSSTARFDLEKKADSKIARGSIAVQPTGGNLGGITSILTFSKSEKLVSIESDIRIQAGIRPICQAKKLLDSDTTVRKMAEQDILIMGKSCRFYLDQQRAEAAPPLKKAIDRIWQKIEKREQLLIQK